MNNNILNNIRLLDDNEIPKNNTNIFTRKMLIGKIMYERILNKLKYYTNF